MNSIWFYCSRKCCFHFYCAEALDMNPLVWGGYCVSIEKQKQKNRSEMCLILWHESFFFFSFIWMFHVCRTRCRSIQGKWCEMFVSKMVECTGWMCVCHWWMPCNWTMSRMNGCEKKRARIHDRQIHQFKNRTMKKEKKNTKKKVLLIVCRHTVYNYVEPENLQIN